MALSVPPLPSMSAKTTWPLSKSLLKYCDTEEKAKALFSQVFRFPLLLLCFFSQLLVCL
jgi:hypothetical protein